MQYITEPKSTREIVFANKMSQQFITSILNRNFPFPQTGKTALCFYGTYGTGKTTYAKLFCEDYEKAFTGKNDKPLVDIVQCDSTENITQIIKQCESRSSLVSFNQSNLHYFVFDEVDNLTKKAQRLLKLFLNRINVVCVLTTNYVYEVDNGLKDRCHLINFNAASSKDYLKRIKDIIRLNGLAMPTENQLLERIDVAEGSWRSIISNVLYLCNKSNSTS
jgi:DNA polymerase III delta prime subunit